ncbi:B74A [miniopterid betaherpesvirus 1]|uniref:B74A n=1 Tax=miniopterid betaherpesvirus 1 TaxID=3070189 RepID=I3VQ68_9BETA|nr:B74A [miniopterid betaherpesvirus 1]AFK83912.1 B74A [miniopterid betaherpesvirus 1]
MTKSTINRWTCQRIFWFCVLGQDIKKAVVKYMSHLLFFRSAKMSRHTSCWAIFVNAIVLLTMLMLIVRCWVGFEDDLVTRFYELASKCVKITGNSTTSS